MDDLSQQIDEIEALVAIYSDDWQIEDAKNRSYSINIPDRDDNRVKLYFTLPPDYPSRSSPRCELSAPHLSYSRKIHISKLLDRLYASAAGETILYQCIESVREELRSRADDNEEESRPNAVPDNSAVDETILDTSDDREDRPSFHHGEAIVDRKSTFQGHAAVVNSVERAKQALQALKVCKKIEQATHNIYAYRIFNEEKKLFVHDCEDDGESQAGGRLLHFLEIVDAKNVLVVVSRWYGGIHLGPDRFRHINNAARRALESAGLITKIRDKKKKL